MRFAFRLILGGTGAALMGLWWLIDGLGDGPANQVLGGLVWKGPLLFLGGIAASVIGVRMLVSIHGREPSSEAESSVSGSPGQPIDLPQLVGLKCASCQRTVSSIVDSDFCPVCGNPVHLDCYKWDTASIKNGRCLACTGDANSPIAQEVQAARHRSGGR